MRFRLVETGKSYAVSEESILASEDVVRASDRKASAPPIIWETGAVAQIDSLPIPKEEELTATESLAEDSTPASIHEQIYSQVVKWAANEHLRISLKEKEGSIRRSSFSISISQRVHFLKF